LPGASGPSYPCTKTKRQLQKKNAREERRSTVGKNAPEHGIRTTKKKNKKKTQTKQKTKNPQKTKKTQRSKTITTGKVEITDDKKRKKGEGENPIKKRGKIEKRVTTKPFFQSVSSGLEKSIEDGTNFLAIFSALRRRARGGSKRARKESRKEVLDEKATAGILRGGS